MKFNSGPNRKIKPMRKLIAAAIVIVIRNKGGSIKGLTSIVSQFTTNDTKYMKRN
jgi:hypothetical protein